MPFVTNSSTQPHRSRQWVFIDDVVDARLHGDGGDRRGDRIVNVNEGPDRVVIADDRRLALANLLGQCAVFDI